MLFLKDVIDYIFGAALFFNALLFIPQIIRILRTKTAEGVSLITFSGFLVIQIAIILHAITTQDYLLMKGYLLSLLTCALVVVLTLFYRKRKDTTNYIPAQTILDQLPGHVYWKDKNFALMGCNKSNWEDFGFGSLEDVLGKTDYDLFAEKTADKLRSVDKIVIEQGIEQVAEETFTLKNGMHVVYLSNKKPLRNKQGDIIGLVGYSTDVTISKKEVLDKLTILDNIIAAMPGNVYWMDKEGTYLGCNTNEANAVGLPSRQAIVGKRNVDFSGFVIPAPLDQNNAFVLEEGKSILVEEPAVLKDGSKAVFLSSKVPLRNSDENIIGLLGISIDITEKKKAEEEVLKAKEAAEGSNRAKTEFLANMSHDVKTPLSGIIGMAELMMLDLPETQRKRVEAIYACGLQLLNFFNNCLDIAKLEMSDWASQQEIFSLQQLSQEIYDLFAPSAQTKGVSFGVDYDEKLPKNFDSYRTSIFRIILNLVGNALKFTPVGSVNVRIFLSQQISDTCALVGFEIKDTGVGIPKEQQTIIFEKLKRLTHSYEGNGIGLYVVDQYVKRMNGKIQVDSTEGDGSVFTVFLPLQIAAEMDAAKKTPTTIQVESDTDFGRDVRILLVEDNTLIQQITQTLLSSLGFTSDVASDGKEALDLFSPGKYQLIYMDIGLPDMDGYAVSQLIREKEHSAGTTQAVPIVALTAHGALEVENFCERSGMQGVISKPLTRERAKEIWIHYGLNKKSQAHELIITKPAPTKNSDKLIMDMPNTISLLGSENNAKELFDLWFEMLCKRFLPTLNDLMQERNWEGLRHELHTMMGSLCYVKAPALQQAISELQTALRDQPQDIEETYLYVLQEANRFVKYYEETFPSSVKAK